MCGPGWAWAQLFEARASRMLGRGPFSRLGLGLGLVGLKPWLA